MQSIDRTTPLHSPRLLIALPTGTEAAQPTAGRPGGGSGPDTARARARALGHPAGADLEPRRVPAGPDSSDAQLRVALAAVLARAGVRRELVDVSARLLVEFRGRLSSDEVLSCVAGCRSDLQGSGFTEGLPEALERLARQRLSTRGQTG